MDRRSCAPRRHIDLAWISLGIGDELRNGFGWNRWVYLHDERHTDDAGDRRDVGHEIEIQVFIEGYVYGVGRSDQQKRETVGRCPQSRLGDDVAGRPRTVPHYTF